MLATAPRRPRQNEWRSAWSRVDSAVEARRRAFGVESVKGCLRSGSLDARHPARFAHVFAWGARPSETRSTPNDVLGRYAQTIHAPEGARTGNAAAERASPQNGRLYVRESRL